MRTTLNLDEDIVSVARQLAYSEGRPLGQVVSELARRGLAPRDVTFDDNHGFPVFHVDPDAPPITPQMVEAALEEI
ncbi:MAG TPA: antitoxin [Chloroflexota bacterium]|jgi:hypothetical protein|nr:antitoxin [Chloroflexota bacterium]